MNTDELVKAFSSLPHTPSDIPSRHTWKRHLWGMHRHMAQRDDIDKFLAWSTIRATMFVGNVSYVRNELTTILTWDNQDLWQRVIAETEFGGASRLPDRPTTSGNMVHQAYHMGRWEQITGLRVSNCSKIVEFGGGYGAMVLVVSRLGMTGKYTIVDFPEFSLLQEYYLSNVIENGEIQVEYINEYDDIPAGSLLIACYSLSEVPIITRKIVLSVSYDSYLIAYQDLHDGIDNNKFFHNFADENDHIEWTFLYKSFMPGHHYLMGRLKE